MVVADLTGILTERPPGFSCVTRAVARHLTWFAPAAARSLGRVALAQVRWAVRCLCSCLPLVCASCTPDGPRFVLTWIDGSCPTCDRTWNLSQIRFTGRLDGWATGETWPGAQGAEDDALLQTSDGGRTWREMRDARSHAAAPSFFFLDPLHGWVSWFAFSEAESDYVERLVETSDGGRTWNRVLPSSFATLQFLDSRRGIAVARKEKRRHLDAYGRWRQVLDGSAAVAAKTLRPGSVSGRPTRLGRRQGWPTSGCDANHRWRPGLVRVEAL